MGNTWNLRIHYNKLAFDEVFGSSEDPGAYAKFKSNSVRNVSVYTGGSSMTRNPAAPSRADFCCDVDNILRTIIKDQTLLQKFFEHYILGYNRLDSQQQNYLEQKIGQELRRRQLIPVARYFRVIRRKK